MIKRTPTFNFHVWVLQGEIDKNIHRNLQDEVFRLLISQIMNVGRQPTFIKILKTELKND